MFAFSSRRRRGSSSLGCALALAGVAACGPPVASAEAPADPAVGATSDAPEPVSLDALRWQRRLVVAFGDVPSEIASLERLVDEHACRLAERDTDVHRVTEDAVVPLSAGAARLDAAARDALAALHDATASERYEAGSAAASAFELVLIGKDGGVKRRAPTADALPGFLDAIDGMPMRRAEMARDPGGCR